jgi:hypothetical protein
MFDPADPDMVRNKMYYQTQENADISWFQSRPEALKYFNRDRAEKDLLQVDILLGFIFINDGTTMRLFYPLNSLVVARNLRLILFSKI